MTTSVLNPGVARIYDWEVQQGELVRLRFPVLDEDDNLFPVPGWTVDAKVKERPGGVVWHTWSVGDIDITDAYITLTILPATSLAWEFKRGWYRAKVIHPTDATQVYRVLQGDFLLDPD